MQHRNVAFAKDGGAIMLPLCRLKSDTLDSISHYDRVSITDEPYRESDIIRMVLIIADQNLKDSDSTQKPLASDTQWTFFHTLITNAETSDEKDNDNCNNDTDRYRNPSQVQLFEMIAQLLKERRASAHNLLESSCIMLPVAVTDLTFSYAAPAVFKVFQSQSSK